VPGNFGNIGTMWYLENKNHPFYACCCVARKKLVSGAVDYRDRTRTSLRPGVPSFVPICKPIRKC